MPFESGNLAVETKESAAAIIFEHEETKYSAEEKEIQMSEPQIEVSRQKSPDVSEEEEEIYDITHKATIRACEEKATDVSEECSQQQDDKTYAVHGHEHQREELELLEEDDAGLL